jgi:hypothetical protein
MTVKISPQVRLLGLLGLGLVAALAAVMVLRGGLLGSSTDTETPAPSIARPDTPAKPSADPATPAPAKPTIKLLPGLPQPVDQALRVSRVVVVSVYAGPSAADRSVAGKVRSAAQGVGAGFVALNAFDERNAKELEPFAGATSVPAVLVVRRPGNVVKRFEGYVDPAVVAQAARNAGARHR